MTANVKRDRSAFQKTTISSITGLAASIELGRRPKRPAPKIARNIEEPFQPQSLSRALRYRSLATGRIVPLAAFGGHGVTIPTLITGSGGYSMLPLFSP